MDYSRKKIITAFLFFALMIVKVSAFHVYSHHSDSSIEQCSYCEIAIQNQGAELVAPPQIVLPNTPMLVPVVEKHFDTVFTFPVNQVYHTLYSRPPPFLD